MVFGRQDDRDDALRREIAEITPRLLRFCRSLANSRDDAEDLAQTTVVKALARLDQYHRDARLDSWLFRIAHTSWLDRTRASRRRSTAPPETLDALSDDGLGARRAEARMELARVGAAMRALPPDQRAALALVALEGMSYAHAAETLDVPIGTVMSRVARARRKLMNTSPQPRRQEIDA